MSHDEEWLRVQEARHVAETANADELVDALADAARAHGFREAETGYGDVAGADVEVLYAELKGRIAEVRRLLYAHLGDCLPVRILDGQS